MGIRSQFLWAATFAIHAKSSGRKSNCLIALLFLIVASCCLPRQTNPLVPLQLNTWRVDDNVYSKRRVHLQSRGVADSLFSILHTDTGQADHGLTLVFSESPITGRDYTIVGTLDSSHKVSVRTWKETARGVHSTDEQGGTVNVRSSNGKRIFIGSDIPLEYAGLFGASSDRCSFYRGGIEVCSNHHGSTTILFSPFATNRPIGARCSVYPSSRSNACTTLTLPSSTATSNPPFV
jgi:hypothetical protein